MENKIICVPGKLSIRNMYLQIYNLLLFCVCHKITICLLVFILTLRKFILSSNYLLYRTFNSLKYPLILCISPSSVEFFFVSNLFTTIFKNIIK